MESINIPLGDAQKLLGAASGDTALLYIYLKSGGEPAMAADALRLNEQRFSCAAATLRQLGLWQEEQKQGSGVQIHGPQATCQNHLERF